MRHTVLIMVLAAACGSSQPTPAGRCIEGSSSAAAASRIIAAPATSISGGLPPVKASSLATHFRITEPRAE